MKTERLSELILQSLEQEMGGIRVYETALRCVQNSDLRREWQKYLDETRSHVESLERICREMSIDAKAEAPGRIIVRHTAEALVKAMSMAFDGEDPEAMELVACECVALAETNRLVGVVLAASLASRTHS